MQAEVFSQLSWVFIHFGGPGEDTHLVSEFSHSWEHNWFIPEATWGEISMRSGGEKGNHANKEFSLTWLILAQKHSKKVRMCWSRCIVSSFFRNRLEKSVINTISLLQCLRNYKLMVSLKTTGNDMCHQLPSNLQEKQSWWKCSELTQVSLRI